VTATATAATIAGAYARCEAITRTQAANFYYGIRLLPRDRRRAMCAVYAFARRIDDIGDGTLPAPDKLRLLDEAERALGGAGADDAVILALADARRRFPLPADALPELIEGVRMDVRGVTYETFDELVVYCRRVAGAIGRACLAIFATSDAGIDRSHAEALADDLGVALQITNILRDVREDAHNGRVYVPAQDLARFGVAPADLQAGDDGRDLDRLCALVRFEAERARGWFDRGMALTALLDRRSAACVLAMAGIYERLLARIEDAPEEIVRRRVSLPAHEKAWVAARGVLGARA
jgi:15-cis-phytoene synthase